MLLAASNRNLLEELLDKVTDYKIALAKEGR